MLRCKAQSTLTPQGDNVHVVRQGTGKPARLAAPHLCSLAQHNRSSIQSAWQPMLPGRAPSRGFISLAELPFSRQGTVKQILKGSSGQLCWAGRSRTCDYRANSPLCWAQHSRTRNYRARKSPYCSAGDTRTCNLSATVWRLAAARRSRASE